MSYIEDHIYNAIVYHDLTSGDGLHQHPAKFAFWAIRPDVPARRGVHPRGMAEVQVDCVCVVYRVQVDCVCEVIPGTV